MSLFSRKNRKVSSPSGSQVGPMIDIHAHILYGLDDGPQSLEESVALCRMAWEDGVEAIVATPHTHNGLYRNDRSRVLKSVEELNQALVAGGIPKGRPSKTMSLPSQGALAPQNGFKVFPGGDVAFSPDLVRLVESGEALTLNNGGRFILVEFPSPGIPYQAEEVLFQLMARGVTPIISHPERNREIARNPKRYFEMVRRGCLGQVTAMSLTGGFGAAIQRVAQEMLAKRLVHIIASDAHSISERPPGLSSALRVAEKIVGAEEARKMVTQRPLDVLEGRHLDVADPINP